MAQPQPLVRVEGAVVGVRTATVPAWDGKDSQGKSIADARDAYTYTILDVQTRGLLGDSPMPAIIAVEFARDDKRASKVSRGEVIDVVCSQSARTLWRGRRPSTYPVLRFEAATSEYDAPALAATGS